MVVLLEFPGISVLSQSGEMLTAEILAVSIPGVWQILITKNVKVSRKETQGYVKPYVFWNISKMLVGEPKPG